MVLRQDFIKLLKHLSSSSPEEFEKLEEVSPCLTICSEVGVSGSAVLGLVCTYLVILTSVIVAV